MLRPPEVLGKQAVPVQLVLDRLREKRCSVKARGKGWDCQCPSHTDRKPSLSVAVGDDGRILLHCHASCSFEAIVAALGLSPADLAGPGDRKGFDKPIVASSYDYVDEQRKLLYQVVRYMPKDFRQRRPDGKGGWEWKLDGSRRVLYRLPELLEHRHLPVWIPEGEKDVDGLRSLGLVATCNVGGAGKWRDEYSACLQGRQVFVLPDNDKAGWQHAEAIAESLRGIASSVRVVHLPGLPPKGDVSDWLAAGGDAEKLQVLAMHGAVHALLTRLSDVQTQPIRWMWRPRIAQGKLTLLCGDPGVGKSFLTCDIAARVSRGTPWPDDSDGPRCCGSVILMNAEDDLADTIRPRVEAAGADSAKVVALQGIERTASDGRKVEASATLADIEAIESAIRTLPDCRLVIIDPVSAYLAKVDSHKNSDMRGLLAPLAAIASKHGVAVLMVTHLSKGASMQAMYRAMGSLAFVAAARGVYLVAVDRKDPARRLLLPMKNNLSEDRQGLAFRITGGAVAWEAGTIDTTADDAMVAGFERQVGNNLRDGCKEWLADLLTGGPVLSKQVFAEAKEAGYSERTVRRAMEDLGIRAFRTPGSTTSPWYWRLKTIDGHL